MINVKDKIYEALCNICENVSDAYPSDWASLPAVQYVEEDNKVFEWTDGKEQKSYVRYCVHIWDNASTSDMTLKVDGEISKLGLERTLCQDVNDPSHLKHKVIRYEAVLEEQADGEIFVYHE